MIHEDNYLFIYVSIAGCSISEADVIFFCDGSDMVSDSDFVTMTTFLSDLIDNFDIESQRIKIGMASLEAATRKLLNYKTL